MSENRKRLIFPLIAGIIYLLILSSTVSDIGLTDDIDYYMKAALRYS